MGIFCTHNSREGKTGNGAKLCLQPVETQAPATLLVETKRNPSGKARMCGRHSAAVHREFSPEG